MKIFIQNEKTALYFTQQGTWADDLKEALLFSSISRAVQYLHHQKLSGAAVVLLQNAPFWELERRIG
jgi:hypothetical protein